MNTQAKIRLPGFTAESSLMRSNAFRSCHSPSHTLGAAVVPSQSLNCNCGGSGGSTGTGTGTGTGSPGMCQCSSVLGIGCTATVNSCNPGFVPQCNCGLLGNSCQCVASAQ
jgi:hypothetical protein